MNLSNDILKVIEQIEFIYFPNNNYDYNELNNFNNDPNFEIYIRKEFDNLLAYCIFFKSNDSIEIYKIFVDPNHRNKKIASTIIDTIKKNYNKKIIIEVSDKDNTILFYKKNGFNLIHLRNQYYSDKSNAYIMEWNPI